MMKIDTYIAGPIGVNTYVVEIGGERCVVSTVESSESGVSFMLGAKTNLPDGIYEANVITESVNPVSFILN